MDKQQALSAMKPHYVSSCVSQKAVCMLKHLEAVCGMLPLLSIHTPVPLQPQYDRGVSKLQQPPESH